MADIEAEALAQQLSERSPTGIADQIRRMVASGDLTTGMRLPTVRDVAQEIGVSVGTIAQAWGILREENVVETRRRGGTRILDADQRRLRSFGGWTSVDLLMHSPDAALLPPLSDAVAKALNHQDFNRWGREYITTDLQTVAQQHWPSEPEAWTAAGGGAEGLWMAVHAAVSPGDSIAVEVPAAPGVVDTLRDAGLTPLGVGTDESGPLPGDLQTALDAGARAFLHWPDGAFAERHTLTDERAEELHAVLSPTSAVVIEDDPLGPLSAVEPASLAALLPERSLRVSAFCRAFGVDMRTAVIGGGRDLVEAAEHSRTGGLGSNSRLLQQTIVAAMKDFRTPRRLELAREHYTFRRQLALDRFAAAGLTARSAEGSWSLWVEVREEQTAALALSSRGVIVGVGSAAFTDTPATGLLRLSTAQLPEDAKKLDELAQLIALAADGSLRTSPV
ncbi:GntR family transcriptional regulator [Nesterenkonia cremea]|uniref:Transcriptional regulator PtsJ n=1 Tax=Nesterenkonia cremea TaxID=1882340 RepID=A0A917ARH9_9MICC|nr:PLP-dependent aminotransferase family protein [Nesterenkonia cremea]GGE68947.1 transcriptional regulator PtsJ [Nesterenkonia cremea]